MFVDTHTHLYVRQFSADRDAAVGRALDAGVEALYLPHIDSDTTEALLELEAASPDRCFAMMGLHPCSVDTGYRRELALVEAWLDKRPFCAVGEIGIDLYWDKTHLAEQKEAFLIQVGWAVDRGMPVVIHSRESMDLILELLRGLSDERLYGIFHCFTGNLQQAQAAIDLGFHLGIGGVLTYKNSGLDEVLRSVPTERLVLETDSPYLAPVPHRGKRNESAYLVRIAERLAEVKQLPIEELARITTNNAYEVLGRSGTFMPARQTAASQTGGQTRS